MATTTDTEPVLDCGHVRTPDGLVAGLARDSAGRTLCIPCAEEHDYSEFRACKPGERFMAYLSEQRQDPARADSLPLVYVTTWTGRRLAHVRHLWSKRVGFGGRRIYFQAVDDDGHWWSGNSPERTGMYCRLRKLKGEPR